MTAAAAAERLPAPAAPEHPEAAGPVGRLGRWAADHVRTVSLAWALVAIALAVFAPKVETALSGAGWQANGSESVQVRSLVQRDFGGLSSSALTVVVHSATLRTGDPAFAATVAKVGSVLRGDRRVSRVVPPSPGAGISRDGHTAVLLGGAALAVLAGLARSRPRLRGPLAVVAVLLVLVALATAFVMTARPS